jgi:hypothetical protein
MLIGCVVWRKEDAFHTLILQEPPIPSILIAVLEAAAADAVAVPEGAIDIEGSIVLDELKFKSKLQWSEAVNNITRRRKLVVISDIDCRFKRQ